MRFAGAEEQSVCGSVHRRDSDSLVDTIQQDVQGGVSMQADSSLADAGVGLTWPC